VAAPSLADRAARMHAAGLASSDNGRPAIAVRQLRAGLRLIGPGGDAPGCGDPAVAEIRARLLVSLAWAESERGRVDAGFRLLDEAERLIPQPQRAILFAQRGLLLKRSGRNEEALRQYDQAVALLIEQASPLDLVKVLNNRSLVHLEAGHIRLARADLHRCRQVAERHGLALHVVLSRVNLGCMDVVAGDLPSALGAFTTAREDFAALAPGQLSSLAVERARALVAAGLFTEADHELAYATEQAASQQLSHIYADAVQVRAEAALLAGRAEAALRWARRARERFLGRDNARRAALASLLELRAGLAAAGERSGPREVGPDGAPGPGDRGAGAGSGAAGGPAMRIAARAQALAGRLDRLGLTEDARVASLVAARALISAGRPDRAARAVARYGPPGPVDRLDTRLLWRLARAELAWAEARSADASRQIVAGMAALHRHRTQFGCLDLQTGAAVHGQDLARAGLAAALASGSPGAVYRWSERARAQALLLPTVRPPDDSAVAAALEELRQARHTLRARELAGQPARGLLARIEALQRSVREQSWATPGRRDVPAPVPAPIRAIRDELAGAALVIYLRDGPRLWALVVVGGSARLRPVGGYAAAAEAVLRLRADLDVKAGRALPRQLAAAVSAAARQDAAAVAAAVLTPLLADVGDRDLVVVPTGILTTVPWAVLPGCTGRPVTVAPSATAWHAARQRLRAAGQRDPGWPGPQVPTLLVAGPGNARGEAEIAAVAALRPGARVLTGADATPAATLAALDSAAIVHIAAHGHHQAENALFSALDLAGGPLLGYDLQRLAQVPHMVVLSSCDLGLTDVRPGDETFGIVSALVNAGAATVVASVARVADHTAMAAMVGYHRAITDGTAPAAALAAALERDAEASFVCFCAG
jgi:tetratricopeptide (TPR) repeat protein